MAEVLVQFDEPCRSENGRAFVAQVCGQPSGSGLWEAWIQFMPADGGEPVRTRRETEQLSRGDLRYWAATLTRDHLNNALCSALKERAKLPSWGGPTPTIFDDVDPEERIVFDSTTITQIHAVVDPFVLYSQGLHVLQQELRMLEASQLRAIVISYNFPESDAGNYARTFEESLAQRIVAGVQQRVEAGQPSVLRMASRSKRYDSGGSR